MKDQIINIIESFPNPIPARWDRAYHRESCIEIGRKDESKSIQMIWAENFFSDQIEENSQHQRELPLESILMEKIEKCIINGGFSIIFMDDVKIIGRSEDGDMAHLHFSDYSIHLHLFYSGQY